MTLWRVRATIDDRPGFLSVLTASLALRSVNILSVQVLTTGEGVVDDFLVDAPDALTADDLIDAVERGRGRSPWVDLADPRSLIDEPTRVLALAAQAIARPETLCEVLALLLGDCQVMWREDPAVGTWTTRCRAVMGSRGAVTELYLDGPLGGMLHAHRDRPPFTPAEHARAKALVEIVALSQAPVPA